VLYECPYCVNYWYINWHFKISSIIYSLIYRVTTASSVNLYIYEYGLVTLQRHTFYNKIYIIATFNEIYDNLQSKQMASLGNHLILFTMQIFSVLKCHLFFWIILTYFSLLLQMHNEIFFLIVCSVNCHIFH
jgi:hypothetical protein